MRERFTQLNLSGREMPGEQSDEKKSSGKLGSLRAKAKSMARAGAMAAGLLGAGQHDVLEAAQQGHYSEHRKQMVEASAGKFAEWLNLDEVSIGAKRVKFDVKEVKGKQGDAFLITPHLDGKDLPPVIILTPNHDHITKQEFYRMVSAAAKANGHWGAEFTNWITNMLGQAADHAEVHMPNPERVKQVALANKWLEQSGYTDLKVRMGFEADGGHESLFLYRADETDWTLHHITLTSKGGKFTKDEFMVAVALRVQKGLLKKHSDQEQGHPVRLELADTSEHSKPKNAAGAHKNLSPDELLHNDRPSKTLN